MIWTEPDRYYAPLADVYWDQGDIIIAPVTFLDAGPQGVDASTADNDQIVRRRMFWSDDGFRRRTTGETSLGYAMIVSHPCSLDKEFNRRFDQLRRQGLSYDAAITLAAGDDSLDRHVTVAPLIPLSEAAPSGPLELRANRVIGYFPVCGSNEFAIDEGVVDLSRTTTIDRGVIVDRLGILSADARATLLYALARHWAFRAPKMTYELEEAIDKRILDVKVSREWGGLAVVFELSDGSELQLFQAPADPGAGPQRPGLPSAP